MKPILFNTEMVRAILDGRKTVTRRVVKKKTADAVLSSPARVRNPDIPDERFLFCLVNAPYEEGDILYVRETWQFMPCIDCMEVNCERTPVSYEDAEMVTEGCYIYKEDVLSPERVSWRPSIHMPKDAARLFLRVTGVRVERLQDITVEGIQAEGVKRLPGGCKCAWQTETCKDEPCRNRDAFEDLQWVTPFHTIWDSTIKKADLPLYGWAANPWVWVIAFEQISKEKTQIGGDENGNAN